MQRQIIIIWKNYDSTKPNKHIVYLDENNLYGWAMGQNLPPGGFKWLREDEITKLKLDDILKNSD